MRGLKEEQRNRFEQLEHLVEETRGMVEIQVAACLNSTYSKSLPKISEKAVYFNNNQIQSNLLGRNML